tara:strand:+ start:324 stop:878 length:555 start_codon:yes stop_codon:yes gene_type:complete
MKIKEFLAPKKSEDTTSSGTIYSIESEPETQDIVPQDHVPQRKKVQEVDIIPEMIDGKVLEQADHSAITEGVSQIFRRKKGGTPTKGFRCTSGPRKGRIVAKPSTCFQKLDPAKGAKIRKKRQIKAKLAGKKLARTKRTGAGAQRLKSIQPKKMKGSQPRMGKTVRSGRRPLIKSKTIKPKRRK